ncbi:MAG: hypothetical protein ACPG77_20680, partial [Nannocystaceae bacterium]
AAGDCDTRLDHGSGEDVTPFDLDRFAGLPIDIITSPLADFGQTRLKPIEPATCLNKRVDLLKRALHVGVGGITGDLNRLCTVFVAEPDKLSFRAESVTGLALG